MPILCRFLNNIASISVVCGPTVTKFVSPSTTIIVSDLTFVLDFRFSSPWGTAVLNVLRFGPKIGEIWGFYPSFVSGSLSGKPYSKGSIGVCGKVSKMSVERCRKICYRKKVNLEKKYSRNLGLRYR